MPDVAIRSPLITYFSLKKGDKQVTPKGTVQISNNPVQ